jgi:hypothetical protein
MTLTEMAERVVRLEASVAELMSRLPPPKKITEEPRGVRISYGTPAAVPPPQVDGAKPELNGPFVMPTDGELKRLLDIARRAPGRPVEFNDFWAAFLFLGSGALHRTADLDRRHYPTYWSDMCYDWMRANSVPGSVNVRSLTLAVLAIGDVNYALANPGEGLD